MNQDKYLRRWTIAWMFLAIALALHVTDEALTGFLPLYNSVVASLRATYPRILLPTFSFPVWISGLTALVIILLALTPLVRRGHQWLRFLSYGLGILMVLNALGHITASIWLRDWVPGVYSSPVLLCAAIALIVTAAQSRPRSFQSGP